MEPEGSLLHSQVSITSPYLSQLYPVHTPTSYILTIHLNIILPSTPGSPKRSISLRFHHQNPEYDSSLRHTRYMPHLDFITLKMVDEEYSSLSSSRYSFLHSHLTSSFLGPNFLNTLLLNTFSLHSSLKRSEQFPHPYIIKLQWNCVLPQNLHLCVSYNCYSTQPLLP